MRLVKVFSPGQSIVGSVIAILLDEAPTEDLRVDKIIRKDKHTEHRQMRGAHKALLSQ